MPTSFSEVITVMTMDGQRRRVGDGAIMSRSLTTRRHETTAAGRLYKLSAGISANHDPISRSSIISQTRVAFLRDPPVTDCRTAVIFPLRHTSRGTHSKNLVKKCDQSTTNTRDVRRHAQPSRVKQKITQH